MPESLNLDETVEIPVSLAGREFKLSQQRRSVILKVLKFVITNGMSEGQKPVEGVDDTALLEINFDNTLPFIALMFGYEQKDSTTKEVVAFLKEHLRPAKALQVFQAWWRLNEVDDFFIRQGNVLMEPDVAQMMIINRRALVQEAQEPVD